MSATGRSGSTMRNDSVEDMERFTASNDNGILQLRWAPRTFVTYEIAVQAAHALAELSGSQPLPLLVDITGVTGLAPEARAGMNAYRGFSTVALVGDHPMGTVISGFARQSATPTAFFTQEAEALRWLSLQSCQRPGKKFNESGSGDAREEGVRFGPDLCQCGLDGASNYDLGSERASNEFGERQAGIGGQQAACMFEDRFDGP